MDCALIKVELTLSDAALLLAEALAITAALDVAGVGDEPPSKPLPSGLIRCGEAWRLIPAVVLMLSQAYPELNDEEVFEAALRDAHLHSAAGALN
jgi:hypothetical protein